MSDEKTAKQVSLEQEERIGALFNARRTARSGGGAWQKGDCLTDPRNEDCSLSSWLIECKENVKPTLSYSVNKAVLDKADHERAEMHKANYTLAFTLGDNREDYFVVNKKTMKSILDLAAGISELLATVEKENAELDARWEEHKKHTPFMSAQDNQLYRAHKAEKEAMIDSLRKLL